MAKLLRVLASILFLACGFLAVAEPPPNQWTPSLLANVFDRHGGAVRDLTKDSFRIKVNGRPATILEARYSLAPRRIVVLLDMSGSMAGQLDRGKWRTAREAVEDLLAETPADVSVAFVTFSDHVRDIFDFSQSRKSMGTWLKEAESRQGEAGIHGGTALFDGMVAAIKLLCPARPGDAIYAITDAGDNKSHTPSKDVRKLLLESQIRLFVFLLAELFPSDEERSANETFRGIARATGGFVFGVSPNSSGMSFLPAWTYEYNDRVRDTIKLYTHALNIQVNGFYTVRFNSPVDPRKARKISLDIVDGSGRVRKDVAHTYSTALPPQTK